MVLDALKESKFRDNTVIVLISDHRWQMGQKDYLFKNSPWDAAKRIPMIFRCPETTANIEIEPPVSLIDIYPSLVDICGLIGENKKSEAGHYLGGSSLLPLMENSDIYQRKGSKGALIAIATDSVKYALDAQTFSYRTSTMRYILYPNDSEELYDYSHDPHEWINLVSDINYESKKQALKIV